MVALNRTSWMFIAQSLLLLLDMARYYSQKTIKLLFGLSGGFCTYEGCGNSCFEPSSDGDWTVIGHIAHIDDYSVNNPRRPGTPSAGDKNDYSNLILLCPTCHSKVDNNKTDHPGSRLLEMKRKREESGRQKMARELNNVSDQDIEDIVGHLAASANVYDTVENFDVVAIQNKIDFNNLSPQIQVYIRHGMGGANRVNNFLIKRELY
ncbi:HNH endonuclease, partial [Nostoc sp. NIES-2111]